MKKLIKSVSVLIVAVSLQLSCGSGIFAAETIEPEAAHTSDFGAETPAETSTEIPTETSTEVPTETSTEVPTETSTEPVLTDKWVKTDNDWSYYGSDGVMLSDGVHAVGGKSYMFSKDGVLLTGFRSSGGKLYCFSGKGSSPDDGLGAMADYTGFKTINGKTYYFGSDHSVAVGWKKISKKVFRFNGKGVMHTGWLKLGGKKFYLRPSGKAGKKGELLTGKCKVNKKTYLFSTSGKLGVRGKALTGIRKFGGSKYYFDADGVMRKGIIKAGKKVYYYADSKGRIDTKLRVAITRKGKKWNVLGGRAYKVRTKKQLTLHRALIVVSKITKPSMTKAQKLRKCFNYTRTAYAEKNPRIPHYHGKNWPEIYANDMFVDGVGNCFSYSSAFAYMAKAIGYKNVYCCNSGGHGWAEINKLVYDPEWSRHNSDSTYFGVSYKTKLGPDYKGAISPGYPWMHVKI